LSKHCADITLENDNITAQIHEAAEALNATRLIETTNVDEQEQLETIIEKTTEAVSYSSKPTTMVVVS